MQTATSSFRLIKKIKDDRFDEESLHQYHLFLNFGTRDFQLLIVGEDKRVLQLEDYVLPEVATQEELFSVMRAIFEAHEVLSAGFWKKVTAVFKTQKFVQVPNALFLEEGMEEYLQFNASFDSAKESLLKQEHRLQDAITIFAIPTIFYEWLGNLYAKTNLFFGHQSAMLIEGFLAHAYTGKTTPLYIYIDRFKLHIAVCKNDKLIFYNQFIIKHFEDYIRYIMLVMKSLGMNQQTSEVILWGYIGKNSPHYHEFYKYIKNVVFGNKPSSLKFGYMFDEVQEHHFFDLYSIHQLS
ncbi:MAG: DUF3822 family protein [Cyclobacteriaceae bacterium]|nr:DUF3822 family protein [Cyclobacteriaceae bacterium]